MQYEETRRYVCASDSGKQYIIIEQMRRSSRSSEQPKRDYITEKGEIVSRLDEANFLLLLEGEIVHVA